MGARTAILHRGCDTSCLTRSRPAASHRVQTRPVGPAGQQVPRSAAHSCAALEALGFFFAGIIPDIADDDILRLQYLNEIEADVASAQIASDFGKELFAYVVAAMPGGQ